MEQTCNRPCSFTTRSHKGRTLELKLTGKTSLIQLQRFIYSKEVLFSESSDSAAISVGEQELFE